MSEVSERLSEHEAATAEPAPISVETPVGLAEEASGDNSPAALPVPRWLFNLIGHVLAALFGLTLGYLILAWLRPLAFPLPWR